MWFDLNYILIYITHLYYIIYVLALLIECYDLIQSKLLFEITYNVFSISTDSYVSNISQYILMVKNMYSKAISIIIKNTLHMYNKYNNL